MKTSYSSAPYIHLEIAVDMTATSELQRCSKSETAKKILPTYTDILIASSARSLRKNLYLNATLRGDSIMIFDEVNISIAVDSRKGLVVLVIRNADTLNISEIAALRDELVKRTQSGKQTLSDLAGRNFIITNLGMYGIISSKPILNADQAGMLAVGKIMQTPVADKSGDVQVKPVVNLSLACNYRIVDDAEGARFLAGLKEMIESLKILPL